MSKKTAYCCQSCGAISFKWAGKCPECHEWNSLVEEFAEGGNSHFSHQKASPSKEQNNNSSALQLVNLLGETYDFPRLPTNIAELDRTLGGGLVKGSVVLIG
ncbi:MAG: DNA repair protein RadA, partial [Proteobacteria bacterium]|nr:DNA repair protein RadA [Pseudomonadota bacterium]